jgi:ABC-type protease/lipase transport system fused ATPase/permease subunit
VSDHDVLVALVRRMRPDGTCAWLPDALAAFAWPADPRRLRQVLQRTATLPAEGLLAALGLRLADGLPGGSEPALAITADGPVVVRRGDGGWIDPAGGTVATAMVRRLLVRDDGPPPAPATVAAVLTGQRRILASLLVTSLTIGVLLLCVPLFTMHVYDIAIPSRSLPTLTELAVGGVLALAFLFVLQLLRASMASAYAELLTHPLRQAALTAGIGGLARPGTRPIEALRWALGEIERIRGLLGGNSGAALLDLPFLAIGVLAVWIMGGWLVIAPLVALASMVGVGALGLVVRRHAAGGSEALAERTHLQTELAVHGDRLQCEGMLGPWLRRYAVVDAAAIRQQARRARIGLAEQQIMYALSQACVLGTTAAGVLLIVRGDISGGTMVGAMMLARQLTQPIHASVAAISQARTALSGATKIDRLLSMPDPERDRDQRRLAAGGNLRCEGVYARHDAAGPATLAGITLEVPAGALCVVTGPNGSGKTSLLLACAGLLPLQSGRIRLGDADLANCAPARLREQIVLVTPDWPDPDLTVGEHLCEALADGDPQLVESLSQRCGVGEALAGAGVSLHTRLAELPAGAVAARIALAAAVARSPAVLLIDLPLCPAYPGDEAVLADILAARPAGCTVVIASLEPDIIRRAAVVAVLDEGRLIYAGPTKPPEQA